MASRCPVGDALGDRPAELDDALARAEVVGEGDLPDAVVAVVEGDDVGDLAAAPLVDRLVVVADDAEVRAELHEPSDQPFLQRVDVLVLVDHDVADVVTDVIAGPTSASSSSSAIALEELHREVDHLGEVEVGVAVEQLHVGLERLEDAAGTWSSSTASSRSTLIACM